MDKLQPFTIKETEVTEKLTTVYAHNKREAHAYFNRGINSSPEIITTTSTLLITHEEEGI